VIYQYAFIFVVGLGAETTEPSRLEHISVMSVEIVQKREEGTIRLVTCGEPIEEFSVDFGRVFAVVVEQVVDGFHGVKTADGMENISGEVDRDFIVSKCATDQGTGLESREIGEYVILVMCKSTGQPRAPATVPRIGNEAGRCEPLISEELGDRGLLVIERSEPAE
jgi:hypothetical protein